MTFNHSPLKHLIYSLLALLTIGNTVLIAEFTRYHHNPYVTFSSGASHTGALYGVYNPALLRHQKRPQLSVKWTMSADESETPQQLGLFAQSQHWGLSAQFQDTVHGAVRDYTLSRGFGLYGQSMGLGLGWSGGEESKTNRHLRLKAGYTWHPSTQWSLSSFGTQELGNNGRELVFDIGFRPYKNHTLTLSADIAFAHNLTNTDTIGSIGALWKPYPGIHVFGRYMTHKELRFGTTISFGTVQTTSQFISTESNNSYLTASIDIGPYQPAILQKNRQTPTFVTLDFSRPFKYQPYLHFDRSQPYLKALHTLQDIRKSPLISGVLINATSLHLDHATEWELRTELEKLKLAGKKVIIFIDDSTLKDYHFASVADHIVLDPMGILFLPGYASGTSFFKGTLTKLGVGVKEFRYKDFKSAAEPLTRTTMSTEDKQQRKAVLSDFYQQTAKDITSVRPYTKKSLDQWIQTQTIFRPETALKHQLVDHLGRWHSLDDTLNTIGITPNQIISNKQFHQIYKKRNTQWGKRPYIAVIYALGITDLKRGIQATKLAKDITSALENTTIKAIVIRVDSPGGSALAADLIATLIESGKSTKPIIISQGMVAGSGGYWLSMNGSHIVTTPFTLTGSIGVVSTWIYDNGIFKKAGITNDHVKTHAHADLLTGFIIPYRNLTTDETKLYQQTLSALYQQFVTKVAIARSKTTKDTEQIAKGRIWSGKEAVKNGLADSLGTLLDAISIAKKSANIAETTPIEIIELPKQKKWNLRQLLNTHYVTTPAIQLPTSSTLYYKLTHQGQPLYMIPNADLIWKDTPLFTP